MEMLGKVRRLFLRDRPTVSEIARRTGLSRNTIKKWLSAPGGQEPKYRRESPPGKLALFEDAIKQALEADSHRPTQNRPQKPNYPGSGSG
jgi:transposase